MTDSLVEGPGARFSPAVVVAAAIAAPLAVWLVADPFLGHRLTVRGGQGVMDLGAVPVALVAALSGLAGWGFRRVLGRFAPQRGRAVWTGACLVVLVLSCLPLADPDMDAATRVTLALMHVVVAAVLIPGLAGDGPSRRATTSEGLA